jgi:2-dehydropantoate 2-reductase
MTKIALIGPGAIGGTVAAWLAQKPEFELTICARTPFTELQVETPQGLITAKPKVFTDPEQASGVDWVLIATKTYDAEATRPWLGRLMKAHTRVAVIQNGVEHVQLFSHLVPPEKIVPVIINLPAARLAPGRIVQSRHGIIAVPSEKNGEDFAALFAHTEIEAAAHEDFVSQAWMKLCGNSAAVVPTLTLRATGPVWSDDLEAVVRGVIEECAAVGRAEGAIILDDLIEKTVANARAMPEGASAGSLHADRLAGNPMEVDARNGVIMRLGKKHGIPTPMNQVLVTLLAASGAPWTKKDH